MSLTVWKPDEPLPPQSGIDGPIVGAHDKPKQPDNPALKYVGEVASGYDARRVQNPKWTVEQQIIEDMLSDLPRDTTVLDIPVGTGRFLECYAKRGFQVVCADISGDMLNEAVQKCPPELRRRFALADITDLREITVVDAVEQPTPMALADNSVDVAVACRITRWLSNEEVGKAVRELQRVAKSRIIITARSGPHPHERREAVLSALDGWHVHRDKAGYEETYRIIELRRD